MKTTAKEPLDVGSILYRQTARGYYYTGKHANGTFERFLDLHDRWKIIERRPRSWVVTRIGDDGEEWGTRFRETVAFNRLDTTRSIWRTMTGVKNAFYVETRGKNIKRAVGDLNDADALRQIDIVLNQMGIKIE